MDRNQSLRALDSVDAWDMIVIGGGATGLGVATDAASRGYRVLCLEQADFAKGTSSRSTKLVHGGVRYLAQGNLRLVREALKERGSLLRNAPHLAGKQAFIIPVYTWFDRWKYAIGLKFYDILAGREQIGHSRFLGKAEVLKKLPTVRSRGLKGGVLYYDGQFDDARMALSLACTCEDHGGTVINYMAVTGLVKNEKGRVAGVHARDIESGKIYVLRAAAVVNATGVFVDEVHRMDTGKMQRTVQPSQGVHVVLPATFLQTTVHALMIPETDDGRVLFMVPWHQHLLAGTTDTPLEAHTLEPRAQEEEIAFILRNAEKYLARPPRRSDVLSVYAGLRPLALAAGGQDGSGKATKDISRNHILQVSATGLITITGGKWTTYRKMAEDTVDKAITVAGLPARPCRTASLKLHGWERPEPGSETAASPYGSDEPSLAALIRDEPSLGLRLHPDWPYTRAQVIWGVRHEMARTVEDMLSRRLRVLFLDARAAIAMAPEVASLMQRELQRDETWQRQQLEAFTALASEYLINPQPAAMAADEKSR